MERLAGWFHQLPRIGSPAIISATFGSGPWADCSSIPCLIRAVIGSTWPACRSAAAPVPKARARCGGDGLLLSGKDRLSTILIRSEDLQVEVVGNARRESTKENPGGQVAGHGTEIAVRQS